MTDTTRPPRPEIVTTWPFTEKGLPTPAQWHAEPPVMTGTEKTHSFQPWPAGRQSESREGLRRVCLIVPDARPPRESTAKATRGKGAEEQQGRRAGGRLLWGGGAGPKPAGETVCQSHRRPGTGSRCCPARRRGAGAALPMGPPGGQKVLCSLANGITEVDMTWEQPAEFLTRKNVWNQTHPCGH